jgi:hypothetical protein
MLRTGERPALPDSEFDAARMSPAVSDPAEFPGVRVAVLVPCRDEEATIGSVVKGFFEALPEASVYVFDNDSQDDSAKRAIAAGAIVRNVPQPGKGNVVRRMFSDVDADCYILVDGDDTYDPSIAPQLVAHVLDGQDLVNVARVPVDEDAFRPGHVFGNRVLGGLLKRLFGLKLDDVLSGYKGCSPRLVKSFPVVSQGFEIETELAVHALHLGASVHEIDGPYRSRPEGSASKLGTWSDGVRILRAILGLTRHGRPMAFFSVLGITLALMGTILGLPFHARVLATGLEVLAAQSFATGLALDTVSRARREQRMLAFLAIPSGLVRREKAIDDGAAYSNGRTLAESEAP